MTKIRSEIPVSVHRETFDKIADDFHSENKANVLYEVEQHTHNRSKTVQETSTFIAYDRDGDGKSDASKWVRDSDYDGGRREFIFHQEVEGDNSHDDKDIHKLFYLDMQRNETRNYTVDKSIDVSSGRIEKLAVTQQEDHSTYKTSSYTAQDEVERAQDCLDHPNKQVAKNRETVNALFRKKIQSFGSDEIPGMPGKPSLPTATANIRGEEFQLFDTDGDNYADVAVKTTEMSSPSGKVYRRDTETYLDQDGDHFVEKVVIKGGEV